MHLVILDRDGVINYDSDTYIKSPEEWVPIPGSLDAIGRLTKAGYRVVVATNQSGLARNLFDIGTLNRIHAKMLEQVVAIGGSIEAVFFCPHGPADRCTCRKPRTGLFQDISQRLGVSLNGVPVIGDALRDIQAARAVDARPILVRTGKGETTLEDGGPWLEDVSVFDDLESAVQFLLAEQRDIVQ